MRERKQLSTRRMRGSAGFVLAIVEHMLVFDDIQTGFKINSFCIRVSFIYEYFYSVCFLPMLNKFLKISFIHLFCIIL